MQYLDTILGCRRCKNDFVFTADEQLQRAEQGILDDPTLCPDCREQARFARPQGRGRFSDRGGDARRSGPARSFPAVCSACGAQTTVPFEPVLDKPVYCADCFQRQRAERGSAGH